MKLTFSRWLLFGMLMLATSFVHAENGCPSGFEPSGAAPSPQNPVACRPIQGGGQQPAMPQHRWVSLFGAIATDGPGGSFGASTNMATLKSAEKAALVDCRAKKGSTTCSVDLSYGNGCGAMIIGDETHNSRNGSTIDLAIQAAMKVCNAGDTNCHVYYMACSLPMQIQ